MTRLREQEEASVASVTTVALGIGLASPALIWSITRPRADTFSDRARQFGEVFVVIAAALVLTRFAVIPLLRWIDAVLF